MALTVRPRSSPRSSEKGAAAKSGRFKLVYPRHRKFVGGIRQWLMVGFMAAIIIVMIFQLTAMTKHTMSSDSRHRDHSDPLHHSLKEQRLQHEQYDQKKLQVEEGYPSLERKKEAENKAKEQRRRLNSTQGNKSRAELDRKQPGQTAHGGPPKAGDRPKGFPVQGTPGVNIDAVVKAIMHQLPDNERMEKKLHPGRGVVKDGRKPMHDVADVLHRRDHNVTTGNFTGNSSLLVRKFPPPKPRRPFAVKRSAPEAPADFKNRTKPMDPLSPDFNISSLRPLNYKLKSKWHGVLLDAGRHYFEVDWIKRMLDVLHVLQYNCVHFRLTDDQAFNVKLESQPDLAHNVGLFGNTKTYTPAELRDIVAYGKARNITIWPEINVPGHGGGWAGIPGLIVQCPEFICQTGYGVPINVTHPKFRTILTDVLREIVDIFDNPPFLHLGGDEVDMAAPCFQELGQQMFNYDLFEKSLKDILKDINYPEEQVIRWEMTGQRLDSPRTGKIPQYWFRVPGESAPDWGRNKFLASGGLYFDFNEMDMAWQIYLYTRRYYHLPRDNFPIGIIVGTFELDAQFWYDRNVVGRLLAVTMGAAQDVWADDGNEMYDMYHTACRRVGFDEALCDHYGLPFISWKEYKDKWNIVWTKWKTRICDRLTYPKPELVYVPPQLDHAHRRVPASSPLHTFWDKFGTVTSKALVNLDSDRKFASLKQKLNLTALMNRIVPHAGIVLDLTLPNQDPRVPGLQLVLQQLHALAFDLIQVRLATDLNVGYTSDVVPTPVDQRFRPSMADLKEFLVTEATRRAIGIIPEISITTNAGGWYQIGLNLPCPEFTCRKGQGVQNINKPGYASVAYALIREVDEIATSGMVHLGSDERKNGDTCLAEVSNEKLEFEPFEKKLAYLLKYDGILSDQIIRWSNEEGVDYPGRLGNITQCRKGDCRTNTSGRWIATVDLQVGGPYEIYSATKELSFRKPFAILAEVGSIDSTYFDKYSMPKRMLAFAMGLSDMKAWSRGMFEESFTPLCEAMFGSHDSCSDFAKSNTGIEETYIRSAGRVSAMCNDRTRNVTRHIYRRAFQEKFESVEVKPN